MSIAPAFNNIVADFEFLDDWDDRYKYLIDLGRHLDDFPEESRTEENKVRGCASQVWLTYDVIHDGNETILTFKGDSDAHIVKGLVAVILALHNGLSTEAILTLDAPTALVPLDLANHLTPQRSNGLASMIEKIQQIAAHPN